MNENTEYPETPMYLVFSAENPNYKPFLSALYKESAIKEFEVVHKNEFNSKPFFQKKFGFSFSEISDSEKIQGITSKITDSFDKMAKTKVFDQANVEMSQEGEKLQLNLHVIEKRKYDLNYEWKVAGKNGPFLSNKLSFLCRTPFSRMDYHKFELMHGFFEKNNRKGFRFASSFPFVINENTKLKFEVLQKQKFIDLNIEENSLAEKIRVVPFDKKWSFSLKHKYLQNHFNIKESSQYSLDNQIFPSDEYCFKYAKNFFNTVEQGILHTGQKLDCNVLLGLNDTYSKYLKFGLKFRKYIRPFDPETQKYPTLKNINFENFFRLGVYVPLDGRHNLINNLLNLNNFVPGFKSIGERYPTFDPNAKEGVGDFRGNQFFAVNTLKMNFYDYPILKMLGVVPFVHLTGVVSAESLRNVSAKKNNLSEYVRVSGGLGVKVNLMGEEIEIMYNILHFKRKNDVAIKLQVLLGK